jgi:hypothetical protein
MVNLCIDQSQIANTSLVFDVSKLYSLQKKLKGAQAKLEHWTHQNEKSNTRVHKTIYFQKGTIDDTFHITNSIDAVAHYEKMVICI